MTAHRCTCGPQSGPCVEIARACPIHWDDELELAYLACRQIADTGLGWKARWLLEWEADCEKARLA